MAQISINQDGWNGVLSRARGSTSRIDGGRRVQLNRTNQRCFQQIPPLMEQVTQAAESYKNIANRDLQRFQKVGERMVRDDNQASTRFQAALNIIS